MPLEFFPMHFLQAKTKKSNAFFSLNTRFVEYFLMSRIQQQPTPPTVAWDEHDHQCLEEEATNVWKQNKCPR